MVKSLSLWKSKQKSAIKPLILGIGLFIVAFLSFYMELIPANIFYPVAGMGGLLGIIGGVSFLFYYFTGSDRWELKIPFNKELYTQLNEEIENLLKQKDHSYEAIPPQKVNLPSNVPVGKYFTGYRFQLPRQSDNLRVGLYLTRKAHSTHGSIRYDHFGKLILGNIRKNNSRLAKEIGKGLSRFLKRINYSEYTDQVEEIMSETSESG